MLISLLVLSHEQIYVQITGKQHGSLYSGPIKLLEPLVVLIGRHIRIYAREKISNEKGDR